MTLQFKSSSMEIKELGKDGEVEGYASVYGIVDQGGDIVMKGAFEKTIKAVHEGRRRIKMLWQHDPGSPIGVWDVMSEDSKGLIMKGRILTEVQKGSDTLELLKASAIDGLSIGYKTVDADFIVNDQGRIRQLKDLDLMEVSFVTFPMNTEATVIDVKNLSSRCDVEHLLRDAGVPGGFAKLLVKYGYEGAIERLKTGRREGDDEKVAQVDMSALMKQLKGLKEALNG